MSSSRFPPSMFGPRFRGDGSGNASIVVLGARVFTSDREMLDGILHWTIDSAEALMMEDGVGGHRTGYGQTQGEGS